MIAKDNRQKFIKFRSENPYFIYESYSFRLEEGKLIIDFHFNLNDKYHFYPRIEFPYRDIYPDFKQIENQLHTYIFNIGMVELISYWKSACSPEVIIRPVKLTASQIEWWKKLYYHGLGEFFYLNGIEADPETFMNISVESDLILGINSTGLSQNTILPIGGGKDSIVSLELIKNAGIPILPLVINPNTSQKETLRTANISIDDTIIIYRSIHPQLLKLNSKGFLNGHTPFSAVVALISVLAAFLSNSKYIALSNESSANEATIPGTLINHQYSKSFEFEKDFREYAGMFINPDIDYFSFLRPLNELQIAALFSKFDQYHHVFRSCNSGSKEGAWCGNCPKCLFTFIILSSFLSEEKLIRIFGHDLLDDHKLLPVFKQLTGFVKEKPFECTGTLEEVNAAINEIIRQRGGASALLLKFYKNSNRIGRDQSFNDLLKSFNKNNHLPASFNQILSDNTI